MFLKPRSGRPAKMPFIAGAVVVAATIAALGLTQGDSVATVLAQPLSAITAAGRSDAQPESCRHACTRPARQVFLKPSPADVRKMKRLILAQIAAVRKSDSPAACRYASTLPGTSFASDPTAGLQRLGLLATADRMTFGDVEISPCHHDAHVTVTGYIKDHAMYTAAYTLSATDPTHPAWAVSGVDVALFTPPVAAAATAHPMIPDAAKS